MVRVLKAGVGLFLGSDILCSIQVQALQRLGRFFTGRVLEERFIFERLR